MGSAIAIATWDGLDLIAANVVCDESKLIVSDQRFCRAGTNKSGADLRNIIRSPYDKIYLRIYHMTVLRKTCDNCRINQNDTIS